MRTEDVPGGVTTLSHARGVAPPGSGGILYKAFKLYRGHFATFVVPTVLVVIPAQILAALVRWAGPDVTDALLPWPSRLPFPRPQLVDTAALLGLLVTRIVSIGLGFMALQLVAGLSVSAIGDSLVGRRPSRRRSLSSGVRRFPSLVWLCGVPLVLIGVGLAVGVVPGVWLYVLWAVCVPVLVIEGKRGSSALRRSARLVRGRWWRVFVVLLASGFVASVLGVVIGSAVRAALSLIPLAHGGLFAVATDALASVSATTLVVPFLAATIGVVYFDLVVREEGLEAEGLARWIDDPRPTKGRKAMDARRKKGRERPTPSVRRSNRPTARASGAEPRRPKRA